MCVCILILKENNWGGEGCKTFWFNNLGNKTDPPFLKILSSNTNIRKVIFDQRYLRPTEVGVSRRHTHTHRRTWQFYGRPRPEGPVGEN